MRTQNLKLARKWHLLLVWPALLSVLIYVLSSLAHPVAGWVGPEKQRFKAPGFQVDAKVVNSIASIIKHNQLTSAQVAKLVPFENEALFQVTQSSGQNLTRRYFSTHNYKELPKQDSKQAIWLAQQYVMGSPKIKFVEYITKFNETYPKNNRLLPVYKVHYQTPGNLVATVHTESLALVSLNNDSKRLMKRIFRMFHTFDWLNEFESARLILIATLLSLILVMSLTGFYFLLVMKRKRVIKKIERRWHQKLAYIIVLPLFLFSISGSYHLLQSSVYIPKDSLALNNELDLTLWKNEVVTSDHINSQSFSGVSLVQGSGPLYRLQKVKESRQSARQVYFLDANTGQSLKYSDQGLAHTNLVQQLSLTFDQISRSVWLYSFESGYSFKNKRLPVMKIELLDEQNHHVFIDPITQTVVTSNDAVLRLEGYSFSYLHMWGWLKPLLGHEGRDVVFTVLLVLTLILSLLGLRIHLAAKTSQKVPVGVLSKA